VRRFLKRLINPAIVIVSLMIAFGLLEVFAYFWETIQLRSPVTAHDSTYYLNKLLAQKYPDILRDYNSAPCRAHYRDYYYISFTCSSETLNTTPYYDARRAPDSAPLGETDNIVWFFGGSTMVNLTASDELTIVNQAAKRLRERGVRATTINLGMGGFSSNQEMIKFVDMLRRVDINERPKVAVFYDGYNDSAHARAFGVGNMPEDFAARFQLVIERPDKLWLSNMSSTIGAHSRFWRKFGMPLVQRWYDRAVNSHRPPPPTDPGPAVEMYLQNAEIIRAVARQFGIRSLFVMQPMIFTKATPSDFEKDVLRDVVYRDKAAAEYMESWFRLAREKTKSMPDFLDLTTVLDGKVRDDFFDHGHTGPDAGIDIGAALAKSLAPMLAPGGSPHSSANLSGGQ